MHRFETRLGRLWSGVFAVLCWLCLQAAAWGLAPAPAEDEKAAAGPPPYVLPYFLVVLCVALGLATVFISAKRRERAKPEVYGEPK